MPLALSAWYLWGGLLGLLWFILPLLWIVGAMISKKPAPYQPGLRP